MLLHMRTKSLELQSNEAARSYVRDLVARDFKGNVSAASRKLKISQSMLAEFLAGGRGAGMKVLGAVARYSGATVDQILGNAPAPPPSAPSASALDIAIAYFGSVISPLAIARVREETAAIDTSSWLPIQWGRLLAQAQRDMLDDGGGTAMFRASHGATGPSGHAVDFMSEAQPQRRRSA